MDNPEKALEALNAAPIEVDGYEVGVVTLRKACVLGELKSPLVTGRDGDDMTAWAETLYAMTRPAQESQRLLAKGRDEYRAAVMEWADGLPMQTALRLIAAARRQTAVAVGVHADNDGGEPGKKNGTNASAVTAG